MPVGVFPRHIGKHIFYVSLPHARGGVSFVRRLDRHTPASSPRSWGCFPGNGPLHNQLGVFPTLVGVFLTAQGNAVEALGLPHARGGVSQGVHWRCQCSWSSPRSWGCFSFGDDLPMFSAVFPTLVGVFLIGKPELQDDFGLPHARGGVSEPNPAVIIKAWSSPRSWGCFSSVIA